MEFPVRVAGGGAHARRLVVGPIASVWKRPVAFRAATVVGFFGAGGMGWYLQRYVQQLESQRVAAILISIVALVVVAEFLSAWARAVVTRMKESYSWPFKRPPAYALT